MRDAAILAKRAEGKTQQQIAEEVGCSDRAVRDVLVTGASPVTNTDCRTKADDEIVSEVLQRHAA